jgi:hypothetical protein
MAIMFSYPLAEEVSGTDWVVGSQMINGFRVVKNFTLQQIAEYAGGTPYVSPYKVYTAIMTSDESGNPISNVLHNTLGGDIVWTREAAGTYLGTLADTFTEDRTWLAKPNVDYLAEVLIEINSFMSWNGVDSVVLVNLDENGDLIDKLNGEYIEIRVYNPA